MIQRWERFYSRAPCVSQTFELNWPQNSCHLIGNDTEVRGAQRGDYGPNAEGVDRQRIMSDNLCFLPLQFHEYFREFNRVYSRLHTMISNQGIALFSVQFSRSVVSDFLRPHESQHARPPCPSPTPGVHSDSHPWNQWCLPAISSSVVPFSSCPQSLPASESFPMSQFFTWGGQTTGVSALASFLPMNTQDWSPCSPRDSQESSPTPQFKSINSSALSLLHSPTLTSIHDHRKNHSLD